MRPCWWRSEALTGNPLGLRPAAARLLSLIGWRASRHPPRKDLNSPEEVGFTLSVHGSRVRSGGALRVRPFQDRMTHRKPSRPPKSRLHVSWGIGPAPLAPCPSRPNWRCSGLCDSPLEGARFEPSVPPQKSGFSGGMGTITEAIRRSLQTVTTVSTLVEAGID
jgi:hypothetical protein